MAAAQRLLGFALYRKIPIYKKRTKFLTKILAKTIEINGFLSNLS